MKTNIITFFLLFVSINLFPQVMELNCYSDNNNNGSAQYMQVANANIIYKSSNGNHFPTQGTFRSLTVFVNIIYDVYPSQDPYPVSPNQAWKPDVTGSINSPNYRPSYMLDLFDTAIQSSGNYNGVVTRLYAESSFNQLILLSDFIVVNIKQSQINSGTICIEDTLKNRVIAFINANGGLNTCYGNNTITEYDKFTPNNQGEEKSMLPDGKIDLVNFLYRNTTSDYGETAYGSGLTTSGTNITKIKVGNQYYGFNWVTSQGVSAGNITNSKKNVLTHEYAHLFLGNNSFHTSGGVTNNRDYHNTFIGKQLGYGLFGGGLLSCNGYERWRLGWYEASNNVYPISSAGNVNSDIAKFTGEKIFVLRDFVTYGDAIRIKLPYKDSTESSNQYIWLENHQSGKNNKLDTYIYSQSNTCRNVDKAGIYAYYQIGKDIIENTNSSLVYPSDEMDNLRIISAEGNYNVTYNDKINDCLNWGSRPNFNYFSPNPLEGISDQNEVYKQSASVLSFSDMLFMGSKYKNNILYNNLPWLGDQYDAFVPNPEIKMDISTNPPPVNTTTYYSVRNNSTLTVATASAQRNTRKIYLTGLSIKMTDSNPSSTAMKPYTVKIRWDDYDVKQDVNWTGDIVLKEQLNLLANKTMVLEQNLTPKQVNRDAVSGVFAPPTKFTCENNSVINLAQGSKINMKDKSSLIMESGSTMNIQDGAEIIVEAGSTLLIKAGSTLNVFGKGKITIKQGGYICVQSGANIKLQDYSSVIFLKNGAIKSANPALFTNSSCASSISVTGNGGIIDGSVDVYIQNETITSNRYIGGKNIYVGHHVTASKPQGNVIVTNNANVIFEASENVNFESGFECALGSTFEVVSK